MTTFNTLRAANIARQTEWDRGTVRDLDWRLNELAGEAGEVCNVLKKLERERLGLPGSRATVADLGEEIGDVYICIDLVALELGAPSIPVPSSFKDWFGLRDLRTLSSHGRRLAAAVGRACGSTYSPTILDSLAAAVIELGQLADAINLDINKVVVQKFNKTSEKVGLATRLVLE